MEIEQPAPTHFSTIGDTGSRIDRIFFGGPAHIVPVTAWTSTIDEDPRDIFLRGISDHACVQTTIGQTVNNNVGQTSIPSEIFQSDYFVDYHDKLCREVKLDSIDFPERLRVHKTIIIAAAKYARETLQDNFPDNLFVKSTRFSSIARAIWTQDTKLARNLKAHTDIGNKHLDVIGDLVKLKHPEQFATEMESWKSKYLDNKLESLKEISGARVKSKVQHISRLAKLWIPLEKSIYLHGVKSDDNVYRTEPQKSEQLGKDWQLTFNQKPFPEADARQFLEELGDIGNYNGVTPPSELDYITFLNRPLPNSKPGPDGIPYSGWTATGKWGSATLFQSDQRLRQGCAPPTNFNESGISFLPKGSQTTDAIEVIRDSKSTRPISTKNTDNKVIVGVNTHKLDRRYRINTHHSQRGFVGGRIFLANVVDLDSASRIFSMIFLYQKYNPLSTPDLIPVLPLFDFEAAFPSVIQSWIFLVLKFRQLPDDYISLFKSIYMNAHAVFSQGERVRILDFLSGVLQGCPGSAFLFNNSVDPFLIYIEKQLKLRKAGFARACADDIGAALRALKYLKILAPIFRLASAFAGLTLNSPPPSLSR